jgi:hypothetical protein
MASKTRLEGTAVKIGTAICLASTISSGQRRLFSPIRLKSIAAAEAVGKVVIPRSLRDFQARWESPQDFSTERLFHGHSAGDLLHGESPAKAHQFVLLSPSESRVFLACSIR